MRNDTVCPHCGEEQEMADLIPILDLPRLLEVDETQTVEFEVCFGPIEVDLEWHLIFREGDT
jgi:hypothetical protein